MRFHTLEVHFLFELLDPYHVPFYKQDYLMQKAIIIGCGIGGLASAIRMAARGKEVTVYEANSYPGGKLSEVKENGFRFDAGPSLFTLPQLVDELFERCGKSPKAYFQYEKLETVCHYFWEDGIQIRAFAEPQRFAKEVKEKIDLSPHVLLNALADSKRKYELSFPVFLEQSLHRPRNFLKPKVWKALSKSYQLHLLRSMDKHNKKLLGNNPYLVQLFNRYATYNGSDPFRASAVLNCIPHLEHGIGAFFPKGGMFGITKALFSLAQSMGVQFHFNSKVEEIKIENKEAKGVYVNNSFQPADLVISNMDVFFSYKKLMPKQKAPERTLNQERSSSALIFYWGIQKQFKELGLHNILFSKDYRKEFDGLKEGKSVDADPTVYINITSKKQKNDAPKDAENWFVLINVPSNTGQDWDRLIGEVRENVIRKISRMLSCDLASLIVSESILDPRSIESKTSSYMGSLYGASSNKMMAAFLRHPNFSRKIKNLYFCGGSVHPGGGVPLCLLSAKIIDQLIHE